MKSTTEKIAKHLQAGHAVTPIQAINKWGCTRLAARIHDLRNLGMNIIAITTTIKGKRFAKYILID